MIWNGHETDHSKSEEPIKEEFTFVELTSD